MLRVLLSKGTCAEPLPTSFTEQHLLRDDSSCLRSSSATVLLKQQQCTKALLSTFIPDSQVLTALHLLCEAAPGFQVFILQSSQARSLLPPCAPLSVCAASCPSGFFTGLCSAQQKLSMKHCLLPAEGSSSRLTHDFSSDICRAHNQAGCTY